MNKHTEKMLGIIKRLLNVIIVGCFLLMIFVAIFSESKSEIQDVFIGSVIVIFVVGAINYIFFKKITLWHKNISE